MSDPDVTCEVFLSESSKRKAMVRASSLSASNGERLTCRSGHFVVGLVAASRQSAAFLAGRQTRAAENGGVLPRGRYAGKKQVGRLIHLTRGEKVLLDADLAVLYGVTTGALNRAVKRNCDRFPPDFMFQLTADEADGLRFQLGTLKRGQHFKYLPQAFTQEGVAMLSSVLRSPRAVQVNIAILPAFSLSASNGERYRNDHLAVRPVAAKIEEALLHSRLGLQPSAFILRPLLHGSLAQFLYINWRSPSEARYGNIKSKTQSDETQELP